MSILEKNKIRTFSIKMKYNEEFYKRVEESHFDFDSDTWFQKKVYWIDPNTERNIATIYNNNGVIKTGLIGVHLIDININLFKNLEREYKLISLEI